MWDVCYLYSVDRNLILVKGFVQVLQASESASRPLYCLFSQQSLTNPEGKLAVTFCGIPSATCLAQKKAQGIVWGWMGQRASSE